MINLKTTTMEKIINEVKVPINPRVLEELRNKKYTFIADAGHGWLKVHVNDIAQLRLDEEISGYSYKSWEWVYLEEDRDLTIFLVALFPEGFKSEAFKKFRDNNITDRLDGDYSHVRAFNHYK